MAVVKVYTYVKNQIKAKCFVFFVAPLTGFLGSSTSRMLRFSRGMIPRGSLSWKHTDGTNLNTLPHLSLGIRHKKLEFRSFFFCPLHFYILQLLHVFYVAKLFCSDYRWSRPHTYRSSCKIAFTRLKIAKNTMKTKHLQLYYFFFNHDETTWKISKTLRPDACECCVCRTYMSNIQTNLALSLFILAKHFQQQPFHWSSLFEILYSPS